MSHQITIILSYDGHKGIQVEVGTNDKKDPTTEEILNLSGVMLSLFAKQGLASKEKILNIVSGYLDNVNPVTAVNIENLRKGEISAKEAFLALTKPRKK